MPTYTVSAVTAEGRSVSHTISSASEADAMRQVRARGLFPVSAKRPFGTRVKNSSVKAKTVDVCHLFEQLELQLSEGVLPEAAIAALKDEFPSPRIRTILREVHGELSSSRKSLHEAFAMFPRTFPHDVLTIIEAGQSAGSEKLAERFGDLRMRMQFNEDIKRTIVSAVAYPAFVGFLAMLLIVFLLGNVFPKMIDLLYSLGSTLPPITLVMISISKFFQEHFAILIGAIVAIPVSYFIARRIPKIAYQTDKWLLHFPLIGDIYKSLVTALIAKNYRSLYISGMPAPESFDLCARMVQNRAVQEYVRQVKREVIAGKSIGAAFRRPGYFPTMACMTINTGEASGRIQVALDRVAQFYEKDAKRKIEVAVGVLKPAVILVAVAIVGAVLMSFFLPLVSILQNIR